MKEMNKHRLAEERSLALSPTASLTGVPCSSERGLAFTNGWRPARWRRTGRRNGIGSQAILGSFPNAPEILLISMEADVYPKNRPER